jgi:hypothetical protein
VDGVYAVVTVEDRTQSTVATGTAATPGIRYVNCTTAWVNGTYDRLNVTLAGYTPAGATTDSSVLTGQDVAGDRPVDGSTLIRIGETAQTTVRPDGVQVIRVADTGAFGDADPATAPVEAQSLLLNLTASESPTDEASLSEIHPNEAQCRENVSPAAPTLATQSIEVVDNETATVTMRALNPSDAPMEPVESSFTSGTVGDAPPATLAPGEGTVVVEWTPASQSEALTWTANLSNFDLGNVSGSTPIAGDVTGLLEPAAGSSSVPGETQTPAPEGTPTGDTTPTPENATTPESTPTPEPDDTTPAGNETG